MISTLDGTTAADRVVTFQINPGTIRQFLDARSEGGPLLKCFEGSATLVSPGRSHEAMGHRIDHLLMAVCMEFDIERISLGSTTWALPPGTGETAYEADEPYYVQSQGKTGEHQPPDLAIEIVVSHSEKKALQAGAQLKIPEMWVLDIPRRRLTIYQLAVRGKAKGTYQAKRRSLAFPFLRSEEVLERLDDPETGDTAFLKSCRDWVKRVLAPRLPETGGDGLGRRVSGD